MNVNEVFSSISAHQIEGLMLHNDMADYFDFLGLMGFKRMHEYQYLEESAAMRGIHRYFINHYNMLLRDEPVKANSRIPIVWRDYTRQSVDNVAKQNAIKSCMEEWVAWERETKRMYEAQYGTLCEGGEIAAAYKIKELVCRADEELKRVDRLHIELKSMDYDLTAVCLMQNALHEEYRKKSESIGVNIC